MIGTLDLSGMAELKPGYDKYHLTIEDAYDDEVYVSFTTPNYDLFLEFLENEEEEYDSTEYYESSVRKNEFYLNILV